MKNALCDVAAFATWEQLKHHRHSRRASGLRAKAKYASCSSSWSFTQFKSTFKRLKGSHPNPNARQTLSIPPSLTSPPSFPGATVLWSSYHYHLLSAVGARFASCCAAGQPRSIPPKARQHLKKEAP